MSKVFDKIGSLLGTLAPTIATALGGPLAGSAVGALTRAIGLPEGTDPSKVEDTILQSTDPATYAAIRKADQDYAVQLQQIGIDADKVAQEDRASAREREVQVKDRTPRNLAYGMLIFFCGYACWCLILNIHDKFDAAVAGFAGTVLGYAVGELKSVFAYYFGSSAGSDRKTEIISKSL